METNDNSKSQGSKEIGLIRFNSGPRVRARVRARVRGGGETGREKRVVASSKRWTTGYTRHMIQR